MKYVPLKRLQGREGGAEALEAYRDSLKPQKAAKRPNGSGSLYQRKDGRHVASITLGYGRRMSMAEPGKRHSRRWRLSVS